MYASQLNAQGIMTFTALLPCKVEPMSWQTLLAAT
jgi:hypothetical protein